MFGKMKGHSYGEVLEGQGYALWVVNVEREGSHPDLKKLAAFLRANGVYPTAEKTGTGDEETMRDASASSSHPPSVLKDKHSRNQNP